MEGRQGHFPTGTTFLEVHVLDGQQAIPSPWTKSTVSSSVFKPQLPYVQAYEYNVPHLQNWL